MEDEAEFKNVKIIFWVSVIQLAFAIMPMVTEWLRACCCAEPTEVGETLSKGTKRADGAAA